MPLSQDPFLPSLAGLPIVGLQFLGVPWVIFKTSPHLTEGKERPKKEAEHSRLVDCGFNKQRNLYMRLVLGGRKMSSSPHQPALMGVSHIHSPDSLSNTWTERTSQGQQRGVRSLWFPGPGHGSTSAHILSITSSNSSLSRDSAFNVAEEVRKASSCLVGYLTETWTKNFPQYVNWKCLTSFGLM